MEWLNFDLPAIPINSSNIKIIETPEQFYKTIIEQSENAQNRISLSSLYLGDGELEQRLVSVIGNRINEKPEMNVSVLLDYLRGTRGAGEEKSSTTLLKSIADKAKIYLYHTPDLSGFIKKVLPERTNEIIGLQHMKLYVFDNSVLISGANLSDSYFTNRQDRYILFENCPPLANFFHDIIQAVGESSCVLAADGSVKPCESCDVHPYLGDASEYREMLKSRIVNVIEKFKETRSSQEDYKTVIYPIIQIGHLAIHQEFDLLKKLFGQKDEELKITMASGYFNFIEDYEKLIFEKGNYDMDILIASPKANGFFGAKGYSKFVPSFYSDVSAKFLAQRERSGRANVKLHEYFKDGWTFHAKGLWIEKNNQMSTIVGSSNYGFRSVHRDLEAQVVVVTKDEELISRLNEEKRRLFEFSSILDTVSLRKPEHHVPTLVRVISKFIRNFF